MHRAQPPQPPSLAALRAELEGVRALFVQLKAVHLRIVKHNAALHLGAQVALVILGDSRR